MPSPFPGMNPFLEQEEVWQDFHQRFITYSAGALAAQVEPDYIVKIEEHLYIHELSAERRLLGRGAVTISTSVAPAFQSQNAAVMTAPVTVQLPAVDIERAAFLEVRDRKSRQLVTVIELLSPSNKRFGPDREQYLHKRTELLAGPANFVELDLLRGGPRLPIEHLPSCDYYALVSRPDARPDAEVWPIALRDPLPIIPIPLRNNSAAMLDMQEVLHRAYDDARYRSYVYEGRPEPKLSADDESWAAEILQMTAKGHVAKEANP